MDTELSLIFCCRSERLPERLLQNIEATVGCTYELIVVDNSRQEYSIYEAYQRGYEKSRGEYLAYLHDDILFHTQNWGPLLLEHLQVAGAGIMGIGGRDTLVRVPSSWTVRLPYIHLTQSDKNRTKRKIKHRPNGFNETRAKVIMLDGVMLCMHRKVMDTISFDTQLSGFHGYDFDCCIQSAAAGFQNYVMYNIDIEHFSRGNADINYYKNLIRVFENHAADLPLSVIELSRAEQQVLEIEGLNRLIRKMMVKGFPTGEIMATYAKFCEITGMNERNTIFNRLLIQLQHLVIKLFYKPCDLFIKRN